MSLSQTELKSLVHNAVKEALTIGALECPDCQATFAKPTQYMDHRIGEYMDKKAATVKPIKPDDFLVTCKEGICKMVDERLEELKIGQNTGEQEEKGLYSHQDDPE